MRRTVTDTTLPSLASAEQFDLVCVGQLVVGSPRGTNKSTWDATIHIDTVARQWCWGADSNGLDDCRNVFPIVEINSNRFLLNRLDNGKIYIYSYINRIQGSYESFSTSENGVYSSVVSRCEKSAFGGIAKPKF